MKTKKTLIITSIFATVMFLLTAITPAIGVINDNTFQATEKSIPTPSQGCSLCAQSTDSEGGPGCQSCHEAVNFAVNYMKQYVLDNLKGHYFLWRLDATRLIVSGLVQGFIVSGFHLEIDMEALEADVQFWVDRLVGLQIFPITLFLAKLVAIALGITTFLLTLCGDGGSQGESTPSQQTQSSQIVVSVPQPETIQVIKTSTSLKISNIATVSI